MRLPVGTVSFLLTDVVDSTISWQRDPDSMEVVVRRHYEILDAAITIHGGVRPQEQGEGDSLVAAFSRASDALAAACDAQVALRREPWPASTPISVRMGVHTGEARLRNESNYVGMTIIRAARIRNLAHGGQVLLSSTTHDLVLNDPPAGMSFVDLGRHHLKNLARPEHLFQLTHPELPAVFEPLVSPKITPNNLPVRLSSFIGREAELSTVEELLVGDRLVTIIGAGGAGKTRLAAQAAEEHLERFPDGVWWMELAPITDPADAPQVVANVLEARTEQLASVSDAITRRLATDRALLVFDNCEHIPAVIAELAVDILDTCRNVRILATSRGTLGIPGERTWRIPSLSVPEPKTGAAFRPEGVSDAERLFVDRAQRARPNFALTAENAAAVNEICRRLDGVPLALELAAARMKSLTPSQILSGLSDALRLLSSGSSVLQPRQRTIEASIEWSTDLLDANERILLHRLSVFSGAFDLAAAQSVCVDESPAPNPRPGSGLVSMDVVDSLERLIDHSLVVPLDDGGDGRFTQLETVRQFGARHLAAAGEAARFQKRHAEYFAQLSRQFGPDAETATEFRSVAVLDADIDNLRVALQWYRDQGDTASLASMARDLAPYWSLTGALMESETWLSSVLDDEPDEPSTLRAQVFALRAGQRSNTGDYPGSGSDCRRAIETGEACGDSWSVGRARWVLADRAIYGDLDLWRTKSDTAVAALVRSGDAFALGYARLWRAVPYLLRGHRREGNAALVEALPAIEAAANPTLSSSLRIWQSWSALHGGDLQHATQLASEVLSGPGFRLATQRMFGEMVLSLSACHRGTDHIGVQELDARVEWARRRGEIQAADLYQQRGAFCLLFSDPGASLEQAENLIRAGHGSSRVLLCSVHLNAGWAAFALGDFTRAQSHIESAEAITELVAWPLNQTHRLLLRSMLLVDSGDFADAAATARTQIALARNEGLALDLVLGLEILAVIHAKCGEFSEAARIIGATSTKRHAMELDGDFLPVSDAFGRAVESARTALGSEAFTSTTAAGTALTAQDIAGSV